MTTLLAENKFLKRWRKASRMAPEADPVEVMRFWIASHRPTIVPQRLSRAIPAYGTFLEQMGRDVHYRKHVLSHLQSLLEFLGDHEVHGIQPRQLSDFIFDLPYSPVTKRHYKRSIGGAFAWWVEQGWALENPAKKIRTPEVIALGAFGGSLWDIHLFGGFNGLPGKFFSILEFKEKNTG